MKMIQLILIVCVGVFSLPGRSGAGDPAVAHVVIDNPTSKMVHYKFKWGTDAEWKGEALEAGYHRDHTFKYNPMGVPGPYIQIANGGIEGAVYKSYKLDIGWDDNPTRYFFVERGNQLDLTHSPR
jgi:hypothetical protein